MKTRNIALTLFAIISAVPVFGQKIQITDWMAFDKAKNHFVATERIQKKGDKARMLKEANVVVDSLIAFARRTGNSEEIIIDTVMKTPPFEWPYLTYSSVGKKTARVKVMESSIGSGDSISLNSFRHGIFLADTRLKNRKYTSETEFPSFHEVTSKYWNASINYSKRYKGQYRFNGIEFVAPCPQDMVIHYKNWSPFDGIAEQWEFCLDTYLLISVANKDELLYSIVDIRDAGDHEEFYLTVSEQQAEEMGISGEDYARLLEKINDEELLKVIFPDKKTMEERNEWLAYQIKWIEGIEEIPDEDKEHDKEIIKANRREKFGDLNKDEWYGFKQVLNNKAVLGGVDLNNLVNGIPPTLITLTRTCFEEE